MAEFIDDVYEPLDRYKNEFKEKFSQLTREKFQELTLKSGIDVDANRKLVSEIKNLEAQAKSTGNKKTFLGFLCTIAIIAAIVFALVSWKAYNEGQDGWQLKVFGCVACLGAGIWLGTLTRKAGRLLAELTKKVNEKKDEAWGQMQPLNALYTWDITTSLIEKTVPNLDYDAYFTSKRMASLVNNYGLEYLQSDNTSIIFAQSGVIRGNPFVFCEFREMVWGTKDYEGSLEIEWYEWERDSDGKRRRVRKTQTLHATVTKPFPTHPRSKVLIYGNDAAPRLSFSREPSGMKGEMKGFFEKGKLKSRIANLKKQAHDVKNTNFTLMANDEFEGWFFAKDRDNEVEFRLLFTPLAQVQLLRLMKDEEVGYGDDFSFRKAQRINIVAPEHLQKAPIDTDPRHFFNWDFDAAEQGFINFNEKYFKDAYFTFAPLLSIPLYQQTKSHEEIWKGVLEGSPSAAWEWESIANYYGDLAFKNSECLTDNILKTREIVRENEGSRVQVTAHGFGGEERIDYVKVYGGDGEYHNVPVKWIYYYPVSNQREMVVEEGVASGIRRQEMVDNGTAVWRRSIISYLN